MNLTFAAAAFCNWQLASSVLHQLTLGKELEITSLSSAPALEQLEQQLTNTSGNSVLLYAPLHLALEQAAADGIEPSQAVALWQHNSSRLVRFCKKMRSNVLLFNLADVLAAPQLFKTLCSQHWPDLAITEQATPAIKHNTPVLHRLIAENLLASIPELHSLEQQLIALAQPIINDTTMPLTLPELNQLVADFQAGKLAHINWKKSEQQLHRQQQRIAELKNDKNSVQSALEEKEQESSMLLEQLHKVQEALENNLQRNTELKHQQKASEKQVTQLIQERDQARSNVKISTNLQQENTLLLEQLFTVQEELEKHLSPQSSPAIQVQPSIVEEQTPEKTSANSDSLKGRMKKRAEKKQLQRRAAELAASTLFSGDWYLKQYPDVAADKVFASNPALHYLKCGGFEGRNPSPGFNSQAYLNANPDVAAAGFNPLYHYLRFGQAEKRPLY